MEQKITTLHNKGMSRDLSISKVNTEFAYENFNVRIIARDHDTLLSVTNERGNKEIKFNIPFNTNEILLGYAVLNNYIVLFTHVENSDKPDHIYRIEYKGEDNWQKIELFNNNLKFSSEHPIETLANYETESVQKVYWVDGINQPRFINIIKTDYNSENVSQFDFVTEFNSDLQIGITKTFLGTTSFGSGTIQYFFTYSNNFGQETNIVGKSSIYNLSDQEIATPADSMSSCAFKLQLSNLDTRFNNINIYSVVTSTNQTCTKVATLPITGEVTYIDTGANGIPIDPTTLLYIGGTEIHAGTIAQKDNTLFLGNLELQTDAINVSLKKLIDDTIGKGGESTIVNFEYSKEDVFQNNSLNTIYYEDQQLNLGSNKYLFFKGGEKYRFGLVFITSTGRRSSVYWVGDKVNTLYPKSNASRTYKAIAKCTIPPEISTYIKTQTSYKRAILVRAIMSESDRAVIAQGFICPTVFNVTQRALNSPYAMSSWFFRPKNSSTITNTHFSQIPANKSTSAEIQNVEGEYDETTGKEITKPPYFSEEEIKTEEKQIYVRWSVYAYYKDNGWGLYGVTGAEAKAILEFFNSKSTIDVDDNTGLIDKATITINSRWRETWASYSGFNKVWSRFRDSYTKNLLPKLKALYPKYAPYFPEEPTEEMKDALKEDYDKAKSKHFKKRNSQILQRGKIQIGGILTNNGLSYGNTLGNRFYIDESIITLSSPDIEFGEYQTLPNDFKFRIIGYSPLTAGTTNFYMNPDKNNSVSSFLPDNLNKENISFYPEQPPTLPFFSGDNKINLTDETAAVYPYIIYPWHKTGALFKKGDTEKYIPKDKTLANLKYSLYTNYCWLNKYKTGLNINNTDDYNYYIGMSWEPKGGIRSVDLADENTNNVFINIDGEKLYYNNYDFVLSGNSEEKYSVYSVDKPYSEGLDFLSDTANWVAEAEKTTAPVNIAAKSKKNCIISFNNVGEETVILPSVNGDTDNINLTNYYLPWKEYSDGFEMNYALVVGEYPYYIPDRLTNSGFIYVIEIDNRDNKDVYASFDEIYKKTQNVWMNAKAVAFMKEVSGESQLYLGEDVEYKKNYSSGFKVTVSPIKEADNITGYNITVTPGSEKGTYKLVYINSEGTEEKTVNILDSINVSKQDADAYSFKVVATYNPLFEGFFTTRENQSALFTLNSTTELNVNDINKGISIKLNTELRVPNHGEVIYMKDYNSTAYCYESKNKSLTEITLSKIVVNPDNLAIPLNTDSDGDGKLDTNTFDTSIIFVGELYRDIKDFTDEDYRYGGIKEDALKKNTFIDCGFITDITQSNILYGVEGDSYYQRYDVLKTIPYSKDKDNNIIEIFSGMVESRINLNGKTDKNMSTSDYTLINTETFNSINKMYTKQDSFNTSAVLDSSNTITSYPTQFTWTKEKTLGENIDTWTNITLAATQALDGDKGQLRAIRRYKNNLIAFQDKGIAEILYNSRTQLGTQQGVPIEIANSGKVDGKRYITDKAGCVNKWSIVETKNGIYFIDNINSSLNLFADSVRSLSDEKGFKEWIGTNNSTDIWNPVNFNNFVSYWDRVNDDVYFVRGTENYQDVLCYNELLGEFTSFFNYGKVPMMVNVQDKFVSFKDSKLWLQGEGDYGNIFGNLQDYHMLYRVTPDPYGDKTFTNIEYRADMFNMNDVTSNPYMPKEGRLTNNTFDTLEVWNEYQGNKVSIKDAQSPLHPFGTIDKYPDIRRKFRIWRVDIPRDKKSASNPFGLNRIRNPWIYLKLSKTPDLPNERMEFHDLQVKYFE